MSDYYVPFKIGNKRQKSSLNPSIEFNCFTIQARKSSCARSNQCSMQVSGRDISSHLPFLCQDEDLIRLTINYLDRKLLPSISPVRSILIYIEIIISFSDATPSGSRYAHRSHCWPEYRHEELSRPRRFLAGRMNARDLVSVIDPITFCEQINVQRTSVKCNVHSPQHIDNWERRYPSSSSSRLRTGQHLGRESILTTTTTICFAFVRILNEEKIVR